MSANKDAKSARHARVNRKGRLGRNWFIGVVSTVLVLVLGVGAFAMYLAGEFDRNRGIVRDAISTATPTDSSSPTAQVALKSENILVMGTDTRGTLQGLDMTGTRSDTMLLAHIEADRQHVQIISLPRDTWVKIKGYNKGKLNWAFSYGGAPLAVDTIQKLLNIHIDHIVLIDFRGVNNLTTALGGVWVDNPTTFTNGRDASHLITTYKAGRVLLKGANTLGFVRERHAFEGGDGDRVIHQQIFARGVIERVLALDVLTNPGTLLKLSQAVAKLVNVDPALDSQYIINTAWEMRNFKLENVKNFTLPLRATGHEGQHYVVYADEAELAKLSAAFANDTIDDYVVPPVIQTRN